MLWVGQVPQKVIATNQELSVVYFDRQLGSMHSKYWWKHPFSRVFHKFWQDFDAKLKICAKKGNIKAHSQTLVDTIVGPVCKPFRLVHIVGTKFPKSLLLVWKRTASLGHRNSIT